MNRAAAYKLLADELEQYCQHGYEASERIGLPAARKVLRLGQEEVVVELTVRWADTKNRAIRVGATAFGPSCWMTEALTESLIVRPVDRITGTHRIIGSGAIDAPSGADQNSPSLDALRRNSTMSFWR